MREKIGGHFVPYRNRTTNVRRWTRPSSDLFAHEEVLKKRLPLLAGHERSNESNDPLARRLLDRQQLGNANGRSRGPRECRAKTAVMVTAKICVS